MPLDEKRVRARAEDRWHIVEDIFDGDYNEWEQICVDFSKYEDLEKTFVPFNVCDLIEASKKFGHDDPYLSGIQIILFISIIEALSLRVKYKPFPKWYKENYEQQKNKHCLTSFQEYQEFHGSGKYLKNFFLKLNEADKFETIMKIKKQYDKNTLAPFCFQKKSLCFYGDSYYCKGINGKNECPALNKTKVMKDGFIKFSRHLSEMRDKFVHESNLPRFSYKPPRYIDEDKRVISFFSLIYVKILDNQKDIEQYETTLTLEYLYKLLTNYLKKLFYDYLEEVK